MQRERERVRERVQARLRTTHEDLERMSRHVHRLVRELKDLHERLLLLYDSAPVAYITADSMGIVREANAMALDLLHVSPNELVGSPVELWVEFPERERFRQQFMELASSPTELQCSLCLQRADGELREVRMEAISRPDKNEVHVALVDETAQRRAERELRELNESLERRIAAHNDEARNSELHASEEKHRTREAQLRDVQRMGAIGRLASGVAHEFNNLLMGIIGCAEMCLDASGNNRTLRTLLEQLRDAAVGGADIVSELMMSSRREDTRGTACLDDVVQRSERLLQKTLGDDVRFEVKLGAPSVHVPSSPVRIAQILMNLSINARQAMPRGGLLRVETHVENADDANKRRAVLQILDTGCGMSSETLSRAFEPFYTTKPQGEGTGLGLSMVADIVTDAGGRIELQSRPGEGTVVTVFFPITDATSPALPVSALAPIADVAQRTVLLVEDDAMVREAMRNYLETAGMRVMEARDGAEALALCRDVASAIDLLITDIALPNVSGQDIARELLAVAPGLAVVFVSGYSSEELLRTGRVVPGARLLQKPFNARTLLSCVSEALHP